MIAVIYKDITALKKNTVLTVLFSLLTFVYGLYSKNIYVIPFIITVIPSILITDIFDCDSKSKFCQFAFSTPVKRSSYIIGKLLFSFFWAILLTISVFIILLKVNNPIENTIIFSILVMLGVLLIPTITIPFIIKFGMEKINTTISAFRNVLFLTTEVFFRNFLEDNNNDITKLLDLIPSNSTGLFLIAFCFISIVVLLKLSIAIIADKEY